MNLLLENAINIVKERSLEHILQQNIRDRYVLVLISKLYQHSNCINKCCEIVCCIEKYRDGLINPPSNFVGLQINKLLYLPNQQVCEFADNITIANLKKLISEERVICEAEEISFSHEQVKKECYVCGCDTADKIKNESSYYLTCHDCGMFLC